jgi:beta-lactamase superfamily II metal-dependent hydrolase
MLDGCRSSHGLPLEAIFARWRRGGDDRLGTFLLTHPHRDHCAGVSDIIEMLEPQWIGVTVPAPPSRMLFAEAKTLLDDAETIAEQHDAGDVRAAVSAIRRWQEDHPQGLLLLHDGIGLPLAPSPTRGHVRAPDRVGLELFLAKQGRENRLRRHANHISAVVELCFGHARIVLGGDLPRYSTGNTRVETGWDHVLTQHAHLGSHVMMKIPHHGSREAQHPDLMTMTEAQRAWCVTP